MSISDNGNRFFMVALPAVITLIYICCVCSPDFGDALYYLYPALIKCLMILFIYLAWRCHAKENIPTIAGILLCAFAVILPFVVERHWSDVCREYWDRVVFLCLPLLLLSVIKMSERYIPKCRSYYIQKRSLIYFLIVLLLLIYLTANIGLYFAIGSFSYDIADASYILLLADIMFWKEICVKQETSVSRAKGAIFMAFINAGAFLFS